MWVLLTKGAVSIVKFNHAPEGDPRTMQVRSRRKEWLSGFAQYMDEPRKVKFIHSDDKDYQWRFFATPEQVSAAVGRAVMDIKYSNFKNATMSSQHGLRTFKLRNGLHAAYNKIWNTLLDAGDGTSIFDGKNWYQSTGKQGTIDACASLGHYWTKGAKACCDCGEPNPSYPQAHKGVIKPTQAQVDAWWTAHPEKKRSTAKSHSGKSWAGHAAGSNAYKPAASAKVPADAGEFSATCKGSGLHAAKGSLRADGGVAKGTCGICGTEVALTLDAWTIRPHQDPVAATVEELDAPASAESLRAAKDAALHNYEEIQDLYARGEAAEEDLDNALDAYSDAFDAWAAAAGDEAVKANA